MSPLRVFMVLLLLSASGCGGYSSNSGPATAPSPATTGSSATVSIAAGSETLTTNAFSPDVDDVPAGTTVTWVNNDAISHTSTSDSGAWNSGAVAPGGRFSFTFATPGMFSYHCSIHPGMIGTVVVH